MVKSRRKRRLAGAILLQYGLVLPITFSSHPMNPESSIASGEEVPWVVVSNDTLGTLKRSMESAGSPFVHNHVGCTKECRRIPSGPDIAKNIEVVLDKIQSSVNSMKNDFAKPCSCWGNSGIEYVLGIRPHLGFKDGFKLGHSYLYRNWDDIAPFPYLMPRQDLVVMNAEDVLVSKYLETCIWSSMLKTNSIVRALIEPSEVMVEGVECLQRILALKTYKSEVSEDLFVFCPLVYGLEQSLAQKLTLQLPKIKLHLLLFEMQQATEQGEAVDPELLEFVIGLLLLSRNMFVELRPELQTAIVTGADHQEFPVTLEYELGGLGWLYRLGLSPYLARQELDRMGSGKLPSGPVPNEQEGDLIYPVKMGPEMTIVMTKYMNESISHDEVHKYHQRAITSVSRDTEFVPALTDINLILQLQENLEEAQFEATPYIKRASALPPTDAAGAKPRKRDASSSWDDSYDDDESSDIPRRKRTTRKRRSSSSDSADLDPKEKEKRDAKFKAKVAPLIAEGIKEHNDQVKKKRLENRRRHGGYGGYTDDGDSMMGGSMAGGSMAGGSMAGGSMAGGSMAGGSMAGGSMAGGSMAGGSMAGGSMAGGSMAGGSMAGGSMGGQDSVMG